MNKKVFKSKDHLNVTIVCNADETTATVPTSPMSGKVRVDVADKELLFIENPPRGERSHEVARGIYSRMVRRPDGYFTITFRRLDLSEKFLRERLVGELTYLFDEVKNRMDETR